MPLCMSTPPCHPGCYPESVTSFVWAERVPSTWRAEGASAGSHSKVHHGEKDWRGFIFGVFCAGWQIPDFSVLQQLWEVSAEHIGCPRSHCISRCDLPQGMWSLGAGTVADLAGPPPKSSESNSSKKETQRSLGYGIRVPCWTLARCFWMCSCSQGKVGETTSQTVSWQVMEDQGLLQMKVLTETLVFIMIDCSVNLLLNLIMLVLYAVIWFFFFFGILTQNYN